jgi:hypothetical protein
VGRLSATSFPVLGSTLCGSRQTYYVSVAL